MTSALAIAWTVQGVTSGPFVRTRIGVLEAGKPVRWAEGHVMLTPAQYMALCDRLTVDNDAHRYPCTRCGQPAERDVALCSDCLRVAPLQDMVSTKDLGLIEPCSWGRS